MGEAARGEGKAGGCLLDAEGSCAGVDDSEHDQAPPDPYGPAGKARLLRGWAISGPTASKEGRDRPQLGPTGRATRKLPPTRAKAQPTVSRKGCHDSRGQRDVGAEPPLEVGAGRQGKGRAAGRALDAYHMRLGPFADIDTGEVDAHHAGPDAPHPDRCVGGFAEGKHR